MAQKNDALVIILAVIFTAVVVGGGVYWWQQSNIVPEKVTEVTVEEPISYSTDGVSASVSKSTSPFNWTVEDLTSMALDCGSESTRGYFDTLVATYKDTSLINYGFEYDGESQRPSGWNIALLPNLMNYSSLEAFQDDFNVCSVGGGLYPEKMNKDWLLFVGSCGSGYADDSGLPIGCDEVRKIVEPTIELH